MDLKQTILRLIKPGNIIKLRSLHQPTSGIIAPAMIPTTKDSRGPSLFSGNSICTMTTDIMKSPDLVVLASNEKDWEPGNVERLIPPGLLELGAVGKIEPCLGLYVSDSVEPYYPHFHYLTKERAPFELEGFPTVPPSFWNFGFFANAQF